MLRVMEEAMLILRDYAQDIQAKNVVSGRISDTKMGKGRTGGCTLPLGSGCGAWG